MDKPILALDIDGVITDFARPFIEYCNEQLDRNDRYEDCAAHNFSLAFDIDMETARRLLADFEDQYDFEYPHLIDGATTALDILQERWQIAAVTSRRPHLEEPTRQFFSTHFHYIVPFFANGRNNPFATTQGRLTKTRMAEQIRAVYLIEDNEEEFRHWDSTSVTPICFRHPWNACLEKSHPHIRRLDWPEITDYLMSLS